MTVIGDGTLAGAFLSMGAEGSTRPAQELVSAPATPVRMSRAATSRAAIDPRRGRLRASTMVWQLLKQSSGGRPARLDDLADHLRDGSEPFGQGGRRLAGRQRNGDEIRAGGG